MEANTHRQFIFGISFARVGHSAFSGCCEIPHNSRQCEVNGLLRSVKNWANKTSCRRAGMCVWLGGAVRASATFTTRK